MTDRHSGILVADPDIRIRNMLGTVLREFQVHVAANLDEALRLANKHKPTVYLVSDAPELQPILRLPTIQDDSSRAILLLAETPSAEDQSKFIYGKVEYVTKPLIVSVLEARVWAANESAVRNRALRELNKALGEVATRRDSVEWVGGLAVSLRNLVGGKYARA